MTTEKLSDGRVYEEVFTVDVADVAKILIAHRGFPKPKPVYCEGGNYKILREVKPNPMPEILPGDFIEYVSVIFSDRRWLVTEVGGERIKYRSMTDGCLNACQQKWFSECEGAKLYRNGKLIWSRE